MSAELVTKMRLGVAELATVRDGLVPLIAKASDSNVRTTWRTPLPFHLRAR